MEIKYLDSTLEEFIYSLEKIATGKVLRAIKLLQNWGYLLNLPHCKKIASNLYELRIKGKQEIRIFYTIKSSSAILLYGFVKKTQKTPKKELEKAFQKLLLVDL